MKLWTIDKRSGELITESDPMPRKWLVVDEITGRIIGQCDGGKETARDLYGRMEESLPDNGNSWALYERTGL